MTVITRSTVGSDLQYLHGFVNQVSV